MQQYFVKEIDGRYVLEEKDLYHLSKVLRAKDKDILIVTEKGEVFYSNFTFKNGEYDIKPIEKIERNSEFSKEIILYQALIRNENFDLVLQKATELGVTSVCPTIFRRNVVKIQKDKEDSKLERFQSIMKNASQQCNRSQIPLIGDITDIKDITLKEGEIGLVCYEKNDNTKSLKALEKNILEANSIKIIIGPEGGIEKQEYDSLIEKGFKSVSLGKRILRSETASFNILSVLGYILENGNC